MRVYMTTLAEVRSSRCTEGFSSKDVCKHAGVSYRQLNYWCSLGWLSPSLQTSTGSGIEARWSHLDLFIVRLLRRMIDLGLTQGQPQLLENLSSLRNNLVPAARADKVLVVAGLNDIETATGNQLVRRLKDGRPRFILPLLPEWNSIKDLAPKDYAEQWKITPPDVADRIIFEREMNQLSFDQIARKLNDDGTATPRNGSSWYSSSVRNVYRRSTAKAS